MENLVLLADEVTLLKFASTQGTLAGKGESFSYEIACRFFCEVGLAEPFCDQLRLTPFGQRLAHRLVSMGVSGTVSIPSSVLDALGPQATRDKHLRP